MIVFDKKLLENTFLVNEAESMVDSGFLDYNEFKKKTAIIPTLKSQDNLLIRIALFLLGCLAYASLCGLVSLLGLSGIDSNWYLFLLVYALIGFVTQEFLFAKNSKLYGYGLDDAFILGSFIAIGAFVSQATMGSDYSSNDTLVALVIFVVSSLAYLRYLHIPSIIIACLSLTFTLFYSVYTYLEYGQQILPFVLFITGILLFYFSNKVLTKLKEPYYENGLLITKYFGLLLSYFAMNYFVVRELSASLNEGYFEVSPQIPMSWLFYIFTIAIPVIYLYFSIKNRDRILLYVGLICLGFTVFTIRFYNHFLPTEWALLIGGILLFAIAYFAIQKLKNKESGITFIKDKFSSTNALLNLELLATATTLGMKPEIKAPDSPMEFGGGGFSGGGAGESF